MSRNKLAAGKRAHELMTAPFVVFDCETTGFSGYRDEIVSIAIIDHHGDVLLDRLIKPVQPIYNSNIHGITDGMVADALTFPEIYPTIKRHLENKTVLAYNFQFDGTFIDGNCHQHNLDRPSGVIGECVMELYAQFYGDWNNRHRNYRWQKLSKAAADFNLTFSSQAHHALADAQMALAVLKKMAEWYQEQG